MAKRASHDPVPPDPALFGASAHEAASFLRALANEHRLMILCQLGEGEMAVGALRERLGLGQSALSQHLAVLRADGVVATRRVAQSVYYRIKSRAALRVIAALAEAFCPKEGAGRPRGKTARA